MRNTRKEQIISASPLSTNIIKHERHVGKVPKAGFDPERRIERNIRAMNTRWLEFCLRPLRPFRLDAANISVRCPE
jgi:hypothetical protein